jgi:hypothetical protein
LEHLSDEAASIALARHFGDMVAAARDLGVKRKDLRRLTWHNPKILAASFERIELFRIGVRSKIMEAVHSRNAKRRRWGVDAMFDSYEFRDSPFASARWSAPARRERAARAGRARLILQQEVAAEQAVYREREAAAERDREAAADRERVAVMVDRRPAAARVLERAPARVPGLILDSRPENSKYASMRSLTRGRR